MFAIPPVGAWSLKTKFAFCSGALMFACSGAFTSWVLGSVHSDLVRSITAAQQALARSTADDIDEKIRLRSTALVKTADVLSATVDGQQSASSLDGFFGAQPVARDLFDGMAIVDTTGRFVYDTEPGSERVGRAVANRPYIKRVLAGEPSTMSPPFRSSSGKEPLLVVFSAPLHGADGKVSGVLLGSIDLLRPNFLGGLAQAHIGTAGRYMLIEKSDPPVIVVHNDPHRILTRLDPSGDPTLARMLAGSGDTVESSVGGVEALRTSVSLRAAPWVLVAVYPTAEAFAQLRVRQRQILAVAGGLCLLASLAAWLLSGLLLRPLKRLQAMMAQQGSERGALLLPAGFGSAELATLVGAYNAQTVRRREFEERLRASERHMRDITDAIPAEIAHVDRSGRYTFANVRTEAVFGQPAGGLVGRLQQAAPGSGPCADSEPRLARVLNGETVNFEITKATPGHIRHYQASYHPDRDDDGQVGGYFSMQFDITPLKEAQARQARVEERLRAITDNLPVLISYIDRDERYLFMNATLKAWFDLDPAAALGRTVSEVMSPHDYAARHAHIQRCLQGEPVSFDMVSDMGPGPMDLHVEYLPDRGADGEVVGFYTMTTDVTALRNVERQLALQARSDSLTGLPNRYQFNEALPLALARCTRSGLAMAVMFLDIDHFKSINDKLGHAAGDAVLQEFACRLQRGVRSTDLAARLGGDEFVVVLEGLHSDAEAQRVARTVLVDVDRPFLIQGRSLTITTSVGIAFQATADVTAAELLALADGALYEAKKAGRNTYRLTAA